MISGPSTSTVSATNALDGNGVPVSYASNCLTDTFSVTAPGGIAPPAICGTNNGEHSKSS